MSLATHEEEIFTDSLEDERTSPIEEIVKETPSLDPIYESFIEATINKQKTTRKRKATVPIESASESTKISTKPKNSRNSPTTGDDKSLPDHDDDSEKTQSSKSKSNKKRKADDSVPSVPPKQNTPKLNKKEKAIQQFMLDVLPSLKKTVKQQKSRSNTFRIREYGDTYFKSDSKYVPTYILPLFHFLGTEEITCTRYGNFDGKHMVKTSAGFTHASFLLNHCDELNENERNIVMQKYGKEWFKIPSKDGVKASSAFRYGEKNEFKIILVGIYEDSFITDDKTEVLTINPILRYEPIRAKKDGKEKE